MRWFNWVGLGMLAFDTALIDYVFLTHWYETNITLVIALGAYTLVALGLSMWGGPARAED
jgi:hypothetical protein